MADTQVNYSIHPRNHYMVNKTIPRGEKKNTCAPRNDARKGTLAFCEKRRLNARNSMEATMKRVKNPAAYTVPGSMRTRA